MHVKKQCVELDIEKLTGSKLGKEHDKALYCHPAMQIISCKMLGWMKLKLESRLPGEISITPDMQLTTLMAESKEELNSILKAKEKSEKVGLKLNIQKTMIMASSSIT